LRPAGALLSEEAPRVVRKNELHARLWPGSFVSEATLVGLGKEVRDGPRASTVTRWLMVGARRITLQVGVHVIGRDPAGTVTLDASGVSRRHAQIVVDAHAAVLSDLGSKNGTHVGDRYVDDAVALQDGDQIRIGPVVIVYRMSEAGVSTETIDD
jgi:hypothetical protein